MNHVQTVLQLSLLYVQKHSTDRNVPSKGTSIGYLNLGLVHPVALVL
jgi:hypothetical protein